ncbi:MAG TPA: type IV pilus assembly protein PilM [Candidatus Paceibacterota bacterium]|nr:type IV pilus assembly protein PilM [Candidatus Paceibacterota bacterium]
MDNPLKNIISEGLKSLSGAFNSGSSAKNKGALGIDIGSSAIKVVQLKKKGGKAILETYGALSLGPYGKTDVGTVTNLQAEDIARALVDVMKESNVTVNSGVIAIPSSSSLIFILSLPSNVTESQLPSIVPNEARKYIPVPISEVSFDWFMIPQETEFENEAGQESADKSKSAPEPKVEVLVVAIHNDILSRYRDVLAKTQLHSDSFEMEIFSNIRSCLGHELAPVLLIDFGASKTKLSIVEAGIVRVFHVVNRGSQDITKNISSSLGITFTEAEKLKRTVGLNAAKNANVASIVRLSTDYIFSDTNSVVLAYEKKYNKSISKVIMIGGGSLLEGLLPLAAANFHIEVAYGNPFSKTEAPAFLQPILETSGPEFTVAVGLALRQLS